MVSQYLLLKPRKLEDAVEDIARNKAFERSLINKDPAPQPPFTLDEAGIFSNSREKKYG